MEPDALKIAGFLFEYIQPALQNFMVDGSTNIVTIIAGPAVACLTIYVLFWGVAMASGQISEPFTEGMKRIIRMCIIVGLALTAGIYQGTVGEFFMQAPMEIAGQIVLPGSNPIGDDINSMSTMLDEAAARGFDVAQRPWQEGVVMNSKSLTGISSEGLLYQGIAILLATIVVITVGVAAFLILVASLLLTVLLAVGPLFILFALLPATQRWFEAWLGQVVNYAFKVILVVLSAALMFKVLETFFEYMTTMGTAELLMASIKAIAMAAVVLGVMFSMSSVAAALGGGAAATASGAIGRLASMGAGTGRMLATGHSKRALTANNNAIGKAMGVTATGASRAANHIVKKGLEMARRKYGPPNTVVAG